MKSVKWLYALFFALTFTLAAELAGTFAVNNGLSWYYTLNMPSFLIPRTAHSLLWCVIYALEAYVISQMLVGNVIKPFLWQYLAIKLCCAIWTTIFFGANNPFISLVIMTVILTLNFIYCHNLMKIKAHPHKIFVFIPVLGWYCYLWIINYCTVMLN